MVSRTSWTEHTSALRECHEGREGQKIAPLNDMPVHNVAARGSLSLHLTMDRSPQ